MKFVKHTKEQRQFIPTPLAAKKDVKKIGNDFTSFDYVRNAADVNKVEEEPVLNEMEPSTANILEGKKLATGTDFRSMDLRALRNE
jgi:hypothetical protein